MHLPLFPFGERFIPPPLPPPLDLDGPPREGLERTIWPKMPPGGPQRAQDDSSLRWLKIAQAGSRWLPRCSKRAQDRPKTAPSGNGAPKGGPQKAKTQRKSMMVAFPPFRFRLPFQASRLLQEGPRGPQERPVRAPIRLQERPRAPQDRLKRGLRGNVKRSRGAMLIEASLFGIDVLQDSPKRRPGGPERPPRSPQEAPKRPPRSPQEAPRGTQDAPRIPETAKKPPTRPKWPPRKPPGDIPRDSERHQRGIWPSARPPPPSHLSLPSPHPSSSISSSLLLLTRNNNGCPLSCSLTSLITSTLLGIVSGWAGGDTRSVNNIAHLQPGFTTSRF